MWPQDGQRIDNAYVNASVLSSAPAFVDPPRRQPFQVLGGEQQLIIGGDYTHQRGRRRSRAQIEHAPLGLGAVNIADEITAIRASIVDANPR